jgi:hypothetical protein
MDWLGAIPRGFMELFARVVFSLIKCYVLIYLKLLFAHLAVPG